MRVYFLIPVLVLLTLAPAGANPAADACAGSLPDKGKLIYDTAKPRIKPGVSLEDEVRAVARSLVLGGQLSRSEAQAVAPAAGKCLAMILS